MPSPFCGHSTHTHETHPRPDPVHDTEETHDAVLKSRSEEKGVHSVPGPMTLQLSKMFFNTEQHWNPRGQNHTCGKKLNPPKDRWCWGFQEQKRNVILHPIYHLRKYNPAYSLICCYLLLLLFSHKVISDSFVNPWTVAHQAPLSMGFSRPKYWSGLPFPPPRDLPNPGIEPVFPGHLLHWQVDSSPLSHQGSPVCSVQSLSHVWLFATPWTAAHQASLSTINSQSLLKLMSIESVMPSNHLIFCHPLLLPPSIFPSIRVFSNESALDIRWPKYWSFSFSISLSNEYSGLISFRMDWLDLLAVWGTLKSLLQYHSSKASILRHSAFLIVQLSHLYMDTGKTIALTRLLYSNINNNKCLFKY